MNSRGREVKHLELTKIIQMVGSQREVIMYKYTFCQTMTGFH